MLYHSYFRSKTSIYFTCVFRRNRSVLALCSSTRERKRDGDTGVFVREDPVALSLSFERAEKRSWKHRLRFRWKPSWTCRGCDRVSRWAKWHAPACLYLPLSLRLVSSTHVRSHTPHAHLAFSTLPGITRRRHHYHRHHRRTESTSRLRSVFLCSFISSVPLFPPPPSSSRRVPGRASTHVTVCVRVCVYNPLHFLPSHKSRKS